MAAFDRICSGIPEMDTSLDTLDVKGIALTHIVKHSPELRAVFVSSRNLLGEDTVYLIVAHDLLLSCCILMLRGNTDISYFAHSYCFLSFVDLRLTY